MINLEEILKRIEEDNRVEKTTKELKELGLNDYYIKKACENGSLEKISRGKYKVVTVEKNMERIESFRAFAGAVFSNDFESAYDNLVENIKKQNNHDYDCHLKLYSIMLKKLLPSDKDFSFADDILAFCDIANNESYFCYFIEFTEAILSSDFDKAYKAIGAYRKEEKRRKGVNFLSTKLFTHLAYNIHHQKNKQSQELSEVTNQENLRIAQEKRENYLYKENYAYLRKNIETENYEAALFNLENALKYARPEAIDNLKKMQAILTKYLEIKSSKEPLPLQEIDYQEYQDDYNKILNKALELKDYQTAYKNIGKCVYFNKKSTTLQLYRSLLRTLIEENNKNIKNNPVTKEEIAKEETPIEVAKKIEVAEKVEEPEKVDAIKPVKEQPITEIDMNVLLDLIYERKYDEVKELLKGQETSANRAYNSILNMIRYMDNIRNSSKIKEKEIHFYKYDCTDYFKRFFEALNYRCYDEAFNLVDKCIELAERNNDSEKFVIYKYLLEDILDLTEEIKEKEAEVRKVKELTKIQKSIIPKHVLKSEDFEQLENATIEKIELSSDGDTSYDKHVVEMLEALRNIDEYNLDSNSFERFEYSEKGILEKFLEAVSLGDYQEAYQISKEEKWYQEMKKSENKAYLIIYKKLLARINKKIEDNSKSIEVKLSEEPLEENPLLEHLATLKVLVKKRKFTTAYNYYQENNLEGIDSELDLILQTFLTFIKTTVHNESIEIESNYKAALNRGDYEEATKNINEYEDFIKFNDLDRNIDYHKARIAAGKIEIDTPDFVEKEQLYDTAYYYFQNRQYEKAIEVLDKYISKDNDISPKGYFLRGKSYEWLKRFQDAKIDYEKALTIAPEPNIYHRLGKINYYSGDYEKALECFLEYEARRPNLHDTNLEALSNTYQALGQEDLSKKYKKIIKTDSKAS